MINEQKTTRENQQTLFESTPCMGMMRPDTLNPIVWAFAFIWAGVIAFGNSLGYLPDVDPRSLFFLGAGILVLIELVIRLLVPVYRRNLLRTLICAAVLLRLGTGSWGLIFSLVLIIVGISALLRGLFHSPQSI